MSYAVTRRTGASSWRNAVSTIRAITSAPTPQVRWASWATTARPVFTTDAAIVSVSMGEIERRSITSTSAPSSAFTRSAASRHLWSMAP